MINPQTGQIWQSLTSGRKYLIVSWVGCYLLVDIEKGVVANGPKSDINLILGDSYNNNWSSESNFEHYSKQYKLIK